MTICTREAEQCELSDLADSRAAWAFPSSTQIAFIFVDLPYYILLLLPCQTVASDMHSVNLKKAFQWHEVADSMDRDDGTGTAWHRRQPIIISTLTLWEVGLESANREVDMWSLPWRRHMSRWGFDRRDRCNKRKGSPGNALCRTRP